MEPVRIGIIGCGAIAQGAHLPIIQESEEEILTAVCDVRPSVVRGVARRFGASRSYTSIEDILADKDIEAVIVSVYHDLHPEIAIEALRCGKHVLVEKPLAMVIKDADRMVEEASKAQKKLVVGYMWRYDPGTEYALNLVKNKTIGVINFAGCGGEEGPRGWEAGFLNHMIDSDEPIPAVKYRRPDWCNDPFTNFAYEFLMDTGSHTIDLLRVFLGELMEVCYTDVYRMNKNQSDFYPMRFLSVLRFPEVRVYYNLAFLKEDVTGMRLTLHGDEGLIEVVWNPTLRRHMPARVTCNVFPEGIRREYTLSSGWCFEQEHKAFVRAVRDPSFEPSTSANLVLPVNKICEGIIESWLTKKAVVL